jgi:hemin uptake protein HemP
MTTKVNNYDWRFAQRSAPAMHHRTHTTKPNSRDYGAQVMTTAVEADESASASEHKAATNAGKVRVRVSDILKGGREAILEHDGQDYRLRITANGKLILTK